MTNCYSIELHEGHEFLGHYFGHDVWRVGQGGTLGTSILARYGNEPHEYASSPLWVLRDTIEANRNIGSTEGWSMPYRDWLFSERSIPSTSAMILALAMSAIPSRPQD